MLQKHLSPRQHCWLDVLNEFAFKVNYIPWETNVMVDALSHMYSDEPLDMVHARSEYVGKDDDDNEEEDMEGTTQPIYTGAIAAVLDTDPTTPLQHSARLAESGPGERVYTEAKQVYKRKGSGNGETNVRHREMHVRHDEKGKEPGISAIIQTAGGDGIDLPGCLRHKYGDDDFFGKIKANTEVYADFCDEDGMVFKQEGEREVLCILNVKVGERSVREVIIRHTHSLLAHL
jgi:hypothetical protein